MGLYETERDKISRTPQIIVTLGLLTCQNHYSKAYIQTIQYTDQFNNGVWTKGGTPATVTADTTVAPDGTTTADTLNFPAVNDYVQQDTGFSVTSKTYSASIWLRTTAGTGSITLKMQNTAATESTILVCALTTTWQRFDLAKAFSGVPVDTVVLKIYRDAADLAAVVAWRANMPLTPTAATGSPVKFPSVLRTNETSTLPAVMSSRCAALDAGDGSRCYYTAATCQDPVDFNAGNSYETAPQNGIREFKFCLKDAPLPVAGSEIAPMIKAVSIAPQKIDPEHAITQSENVSLELYDDATRANWNQDKASDGALTNTTTPSGTFLRRLMRIYRNYANPRNYAKINVGFVAAGSVESDFKQRGKYLVKNLVLNADGSSTLTLIDRLRLLKTKCPAKISETNLLNGGINNAVTALIVDDGTELTPPGSGYTVTIMIDSEFLNVTAISGNTLTVQRGRWGSSAASHSDNAVWKEILMYGTEQATPSLTPLGKNPIDILVEILSRAGVAAADIDTATLNQERDDWIPSSVNATTGVQTGTTFQRAGATLDVHNGGISNQTDYETLIKQLREVIPLSLFVGEDQRVTGRVFAPARPSVTLTELTDNENLVKGSIEIDDNEESRADIILIGYDLASGDGTKLTDYARVLGRADADSLASGNYGDRRTKVILSPWIRAGDSSTVSRLAVHVLGRYRNPARKVKAKLEVKDDGVKCGDFVYLSTARFQKPDGSTDSQRIVEVQSKERDPDTHALSMSFQDTGLIYRYGFIAPAGYPNYDAATAAQRRYAFIGSVTNNQVGTAKDAGYRIW